MGFLKQLEKILNMLIELLADNYIAIMGFVLLITIILVIFLENKKTENYKTVV